MLQLVFIGIFVAGGFWFYNSFLLGNKKNNIVLTFDDRFTNLDEHITAIKRELTYEGRKVEYLGNRKFIVDGKPYIFVERTVPNLGEGVPVQQTILLPFILVFLASFLTIILPRLYLLCNIRKHFFSVLVYFFVIDHMIECDFLIIRKFFD